MPANPKLKPFEKPGKDAKSVKPGGKKDAGPDKTKSDKFPPPPKKK